MNVMLERTFRQTLEDPTTKNIHAVIDDIKQVAEYIDSKTGDLSTIPESDLVTAIKGLTAAVEGLKATLEEHVEELPEESVDVI